MFAALLLALAPQGPMSLVIDGVLFERGTRIPRTRNPGCLFAVFVRPANPKRAERAAAPPGFL